MGALEKTYLLVTMLALIHSSPSLLHSSSSSSETPPTPPKSSSGGGGGISSSIRSASSSATPPPSVSSVDSSSTSQDDESRLLGPRVSSLVFAQSSGGGDSSQGDLGQDDGSTSPEDPNLVNPQNSQGYGKNVPSQIVETKPMKPVTKTEKTKSMGEQTMQAALQLGVLVSI